MKISREFTLVILCLFLFVMIINVINESSISLYSSFDSISIAGTNNSREDKEKMDISDIAYGIGDRIDSSSISNIAINIERIEVFDGLTIEELSAKLNRSLKGVLANQGYFIATKSIALGINPYMAVAIMLHETGCNYSCSSLARINYNVGGMKGQSGKYQKFSSIEAGINAFLNNLYKNYYKRGLTTPETIGPKYAASSTWASKINSYMKKIRSN